MFSKCLVGALVSCYLLANSFLKNLLVLGFGPTNSRPIDLALSHTLALLRNPFSRRQHTPTCRVSNLVPETLDLVPGLSFSW